MLQKPRTLPRIDLAHHRLTALTMRLELEWSNDLDDLFGWNDEIGGLMNEILGQSEPLIFPYTQHNVRFAIMVVNDISALNEEWMQVGIRYLAVPKEVRIPPMRGNTERAFLRLLGGLPLQAPLEAGAEYEFPGVKQADLWYPLPNRVGAPPESPLFEVQGIRGDKLNDAGDATEFKWVMDWIDDLAALAVSFQMPPHFDEHIPLKVLEQADVYARLMIHA